jgi:hypothetical protein
MKFLSAVVLFSLSLTAFAQDAEMIAKIKEHKLANIDKRIGYLNELKSCVSAAQNKDAFKTCHQTHKAQVKTLKDSNEGWREGMKAERQAKKAKK